MMMMTRIPNALGGGYYGTSYPSLALNARPKASASTTPPAAPGLEPASAFALPALPTAGGEGTPEAPLKPEAAAPATTPLLPHAFEDINAVAQKAGFLPVQAKEVLRAYRLNQSLFVDVKV